MAHLCCGCRPGICLDRSHENDRMFFILPFAQNNWCFLSSLYEFTVHVKCMHYLMCSRNYVRFFALFTGPSLSADL